MKSLLRCAALLGAASIMLTACGGDDEESAVATSSVITTTVVETATDDLFTEAESSDAPAVTTPASEAPVGTDAGPVGTDVDAPVSTDSVSVDSAPVGTDVATTDAPPATTGTASRGGSTDPTIDPAEPTGTIECRGAATVRTALIDLDDVEFDADSSDAEVAAALQVVSDAFDELAATTSGEVSADAALLAEGFGYEASGGRFGEDLTPEQEDLLSSDEYFDARERFDSFASSQCGIDVV